MNNNLLILAESIDANDSSATKGRVALIKNLSRIGFNVTVLHYTRRNISLEVIKSIAIKERKLSLNYILSKLQTYLHKWFKIDIGWRMQQWFGFSFSFFNDAKSMAIALKSYNPKDFYQIWTLSKGNSYRTHKALLLSPQWHSKWFAYVHDPYPSHLYPRPFNYVHSGYLKKHLFFDEVCKRANKVVFPSHLLADWMRSYFPSIQGKELVVPHQIDKNLQIDTKLASTFIDTSNFNILLAGNLLSLRNPKPLLNAFLQFLEANPSAKNQIRLIILGNTKGFEDIIASSAEKAPQIVAVKKRVDFITAYSVQNLVDVNVILEAKSEISPFLPGKFPHIVKANTALLYIGPHLSEVNRLLGDDYPFSFENSEELKIQKSIEKLYMKWLNDKTSLKLDRVDLKDYLSVSYLKQLV
jgi:glycosyltransferase involved in cell wall biosynthesis